MNCEFTFKKDFKINYFSFFRFFLVNLNSDPSLNELLVYYLKPVADGATRVGCSDEADIQLQGVGLHPEHCSIEIGKELNVHFIYLVPCSSSF